ncbi:MAG: hypothetical protein ACREXY_07695 [Gammaproteobacteria bacterium]
MVPTVAWGWRFGQQHGTRWLAREGIEELVVNSTGRQGSALLTSMSAADCFIVLPAA